MYLKLGEVPVVVATSPNAAHKIMRTHDVTFATRPWSSTMKILMADGYGLGFVPYGDHWRQLRKISVLELLSARRVQSFRHVREEEAARLVAAVAATPAGEPANLSELVAETIADTTVRALIGDRFERREEFLKTIEEESKLTSGFNLTDLFPSSWLVSFLSDMSMELMEHAIKQHEEARATMVLLRIQKEGGLNVPLTNGTIKALIVDLFGVGSKTTAITLQWAMSELIRHPEMMKKAQAEVSNILNGKPRVTEDDLGEMKYLKLLHPHPHPLN
ncbi:hypothetical protein HU200_031002 [Digitaria exilis]|uniref:Cytochrome P450 n=1 Tax=Digitaria exilis TaxID=1010633 RepID=A0A835BRW4_9POAL|nr:hypothetical protein HU200_031002 [Digitaria exilis]